MKTNSENKRNFTSIKVTITKPELTKFQNPHDFQGNNQTCNDLPELRQQQGLIGETSTPFKFNKNMVKIKHKKIFFFSNKQQMENWETKEALNKTHDEGRDDETISATATAVSRTQPTTSTVNVITTPATTVTMSSSTSPLSEILTAMPAVRPTKASEEEYQPLPHLNYQQQRQHHLHKSNNNKEMKNCNQDNELHSTKNSNSPITNTTSSSSAINKSSKRQQVTTSAMNIFRENRNNKNSHVNELHLGAFYNTLATFIFKQTKMQCGTKSRASSTAPATPGTRKTRTSTSTTSTSTTTIQFVSQLLVLLTMASLVGYAHAGFACLSNPCVFGVCIDGLNSSYSCYCIDGYTGIQCQTNWDECWSGPCQNGGTCVDGVAYYNCTCPDGFSGANCEENVDECMSNPCQNGGHCRDRNNGYTCTCQPGYLGDHCEVDVAVCETGTGARCQNGGECLEGPGLEFYCECPAGWHGRICQDEINECDSSPCQNGGMCVDKLASYVCACPMGYTGTNCEEEILICADNPCQNNALCLMEEGVPTCYCVPDYHGEKCEYQYDECQLGPRCMNGGVCIDGVDTFSCSCPPLLTGMLCECLMIGEDSLDCNYTARSTTAPPTMKPRPTPELTTVKSTLEDTTMSGHHGAGGGAAGGGVEDVSESISKSHEEETEEEEDEDEEGHDKTKGAGDDEDSLEKPSTRPIGGSGFGTGADDDVTPTTAGTHVLHGSTSASDEEDEDGHPSSVGTTDIPTSHDRDRSSSELPGHGGVTEDIEHSGEVTATTATRYDETSGGSDEASSTAKPITTGRDTDVYTTVPLSGESGGGSEGATSDSDEDQTGIYVHPTRPIYTQHHFTTVETSIGIEYSTSQYSYGMPTYYPTLEIPHVTSKPESDSHIRPYSERPETKSSEEDEGGHESDGGGDRLPTTPRFVIRPEIATTAAPFFTEYPEVVVTTKYMDLSPSGGHAPTTQSPIRGPSYTVTTISSSFDYETIEVSTMSPGISVTVHLPENRTYHPYTPLTTTPSTSIYHPATTYVSKSDYETTPHYQGPPTSHPLPHHPDAPMTTGHPLYTEDHHYHGTTTMTPPSLASSGTTSATHTSQQVPDVPMTTQASPTTNILGQGGVATTQGPRVATTTEYKPIITYVPPTTYSVPTYRPATSAPPTSPPTTMPPTLTTGPPPSAYPTTSPSSHGPSETSPTSAAPAYGTQIPVVSSKYPVTEASSEEEESANTVGTGLGVPASGGSTDIEPHTDCIKMGCYNGGTCVTTSEGSRCVCRFDRQGALCETPIIIKNAAFSGDSYVSHRIHKDIQHHDSLDTVLPMHVQLKVRTRATNGLIMLAAAQGTKGGHYMALFLQKGLLQFQFSCGLQTMLLSELETPVNTGHEITIRAELDFSRNYTHCNASLLVNDTLAMSGDQPTWLKLLPPRMHTPETILNTWLHLGGAPQAPIGLIIELPPSQSGTGFTGCLHSLKINEDSREIFGDALDGFGITECGSLACLSSPCRNGAACIKIETNEVDDNGDKVEKWKCKCPSGYMGPTCEISVCEDNPCQYGGTCVQFPGSGYLCLCPLGKHGHYCEHNLEVALPSFSGSVNGLSSFVAYTVPIPLEYSMELSFKILPQTMSQIALLAFLGQPGYHDEKSDHLAISFIQGYIMLTWNLGAGPRRIFTQKPIDFRLDAPRVPYEIKVGRIGRQAWLSVDGKFNITGRSPGSVSRMDVLPILYLGGHEIANFNTLPHDLPLHSGFQGCIYDVHLKAGQVTVPLQETRGVRGRGVGQCGTRECHRHACQHDGACLQHGATFTCICQEGWYGPLCAQPTNPCDSFNNKCSEESTCVPLVNGYECDCPVGQTGKNCEEEIHSLSDVSLTGRRSYLAVRWPYLYDNSDKMGAKRSQIISYRNFTKKLMPPKPIASSNQHFVMKLLNEVEKQRNFSPVPLMGSKSFEEHHRVQFFFIEFQLRPLSERGLLLYFGSLNKNMDKKIGFVSLSLQGGVVEFRISGPSNHVTVVRSVRMLAIGEWHKIKMAQRGRWLTLWVEGSASSALAPSAEVLVEPDALLYVGGLKDLSKLPHNAISGFPVPFRGCVRGLVVSGTRIVLNETNIIESRNIRDCDGTACGGDSCEAGGHCWLDEKLQPHCICPEYAKGDRCEYSETCKLIPCKNNGRCLRSGRCSCPNGWGGFYCEIALSKPTTPSFRGNSYLILPPPRIPMKDKRKGPSMFVRPREAIQISLNFSTIEPDGLLLWSEHDRQKFLGLGLENGHLKIASNLLGSDNDTVSTPSSGFITDGSWHMARIVVDRSHLELQLDGEVIFTEKLASQELMQQQQQPSSTTSPHRTRSRNSLLARRGKEPTITYEDLFYLGGFPNLESVSKRTQGRYDQPFKGCLQDIQFGAEPNALIKDFSTYQGENIGSCDLHGDEPIVV
ncbi:protein eyes shut isoform X2 [Musca domestica]|uniref:Protein eyes shut isoform X2 n=1 Tax=Musca domestica TaxID=7370 RepID=A0ABM3V4K3_MUSDO|nr:protein eyes shut isoform X2 [Musca domestica]